MALQAARIMNQAAVESVQEQKNGNKENLIAFSFGILDDFLRLDTARIRAG